MKTKKITYEIGYPIEDVFSRISAAIYLDLNQNAQTLNTSYAQPVGTKFQYKESSFGQSLDYTGEITAYEKPRKFSYLLSDDKIETLIDVTFTPESNGTIVTFEIGLKNANLAQRMMKRNHVNGWIKKFEEFKDYAEKIIKASK